MKQLFVVDEQKTVMYICTDFKMNFIILCMMSFNINAQCGTGFF